MKAYKRSLQGGVESPSVSLIVIVPAASARVVQRSQWNINFLTCKAASAIANKYKCRASVDVIVLFSSHTWTHTGVIKRRFNVGEFTLWFALYVSDVALFCYHPYGGSMRLNFSAFNSGSV